MSVCCNQHETCQGEAPGQSGRLTSVEDALSIAEAIVAPPLEVEQLDLQEAVGGVAAGTVRAPRPMPLFNQSAMDGFAVRSADLVGMGPWRLPVVGTIAAGDSPNPGFSTEAAATRIYTGAAVPTDCDAVVMLEHCRDKGNTVVVEVRPDAGQNVRVRGSDIACNEPLIAAGTRIEPRHVGLLAANGCTSIAVFKRPRVGVFSTGRELLPTGTPGDRRIHDSNRPMLIALAQCGGAEVVDLGIVDDDFDQTVRFFREVAGTFDLLVSSGAVSMGARDFVRPAFVEAGGTVHAWRVALKPGKPILFGTLENKAYLGLPGNPLSAFVGFHLFGQRQVSRLCGEDKPPGELGRAIAGFSLARQAGRLEIVPARIVTQSKEGVPTVEPIGNGSSGTLHALCQADGLAVVPAERDSVAPGDVIAFCRFSSHADFLGLELR